MTLQELFDIVWERAKDPRKALMTNEDMEGFCAYRNEDGLCCFLGAAIPPGKYDIKFDRGFSDATNAARAVMEACGLPEELTSRVSELQRIHDKLTPDQWERNLRAYATGYNLTIPEWREVSNV